MGQTGRNDPCACGSGKKYKKCCMLGKQGRLSKENFFKRGSFTFCSLIVIFILCIGLRYYGFHQPHGLTFDEGLYSGLLAEQLKNDPGNYSTQAAYQYQTSLGKPFPKYLDRPLFKHPPVYCYLIAFNYKLFGSSNLVAVSVSIIAGSLMVLIVFLLGKVLYDDRVGLLAAFFLCIDPVHWVCSERIWMESTLSFFMLLAVFLFVLGQKQKIYLLFSGISIGLAVLTKYPGILSLFIICSFVVLMERSMLKQKGFWILCILPFLMFLPWIIWNMKAYGNLYNAVISVHSLGGAVKYAAQKVLENKGIVLFFSFLLGLFFVMKNKVSCFLGMGQDNQMAPKRKKFIKVLFFLTMMFFIIMIPLLRKIVVEAFIWKNAILTGWWNPFGGKPWDFYLIRLSELSPAYLFSFLSVFFVFGKNKGDILLLLSSVWILGAFIILGNYQSRYILPAVPFLIILSARCQVWVYDKLSLSTSQETSEEPSKFEAYRVLLKTIFIGIGLYFVIQTLKADQLIAIGPDFGYF